MSGWKETRSVFRLFFRVTWMQSPTFTCRVSGCAALAPEGMAASSSSRTNILPSVFLRIRSQWVLNGHHGKPFRRRIRRAACASGITNALVSRQRLEIRLGCVEDADDPPGALRKLGGAAVIEEVVPGALLRSPGGRDGQVIALGNAHVNRVAGSRLR